MDDVLRAAGMWLVVACAALSLAVVVVHHVLARWWETPAGRHVFIYEAVLAQVLGLWALRIIVPDGAWFQIARFVAFALVPVVLAWRLVIIIRTWRRLHRRP